MTQKNKEKKIYVATLKEKKEFIGLYTCALFLKCIFNGMSNWSQDTWRDLLASLEKSLIIVGQEVGKFANETFRRK